MITTEQAAKRKGVHRQLIIRWIRQGKIKAHAIGNGRRKIWVIDEESLDKYVPPNPGRPKKGGPNETH